MLMINVSVLYSHKSIRSRYVAFTYLVGASSLDRCPFSVRWENVFVAVFFGLSIYRVMAGMADGCLSCKSKKRFFILAFLFVIVHFTSYLVTAPVVTTFSISIFFDCTEGELQAPFFTRNGRKIRIHFNLPS